jgi:hypothetical protein
MGLSQSINFMIPNLSVGFHQLQLQLFGENPVCEHEMYPHFPPTLIIQEGD